MYFGFGFTAAFLACIVLTCFIFSILFWPTEDENILNHQHKTLVHSHAHGHNDQHHIHHIHQHANDLDQESHNHEHEHHEVAHKHKFVIDLHHQEWPKG